MIAIAVVQALLFGDVAAPDCSAKADPIVCAIDARYAKDDRAKHLAEDLFKHGGDIAGVGADEQMDGGYRGMIHLVPELPIGKYREHLARVVVATDAIDKFFTDVMAGKQPAYRWRELAFRFVRSVGKHTPSAYALIASALANRIASGNFKWCFARSRAADSAMSAVSSTTCQDSSTAR